MSADRPYHQDRDRLLAECRALLEAIARQPYALKRDRAAKAGLEMVRGYKLKNENVNEC
jgi:hypothetical protein